MIKMILALPVFAGFDATFQRFPVYYAILVGVIRFAGFDVFAGFDGFYDVLKLRYFPLAVLGLQVSTVLLICRAVKFRMVLMSLPVLLVSHILHILSGCD